jgi:signal transduction histidine kinase/ActR/RegA family two-component response regulator
MVAGQRVFVDAAALIAAIAASAAGSTLPVQGVLALAAQRAGPGRWPRVIEPAARSTPGDAPQGALSEPALPELLRATFDALPAHVCVLDGAGRILWVNEGWRRFAGANGGDPDCVGVGTNYLAVCGRSESRPSADGVQAHEFGARLQALLDGRLMQFELEYPCHSPTERRWYLVNVARLGPPAEGCAVVMHTAVTSRKLAEQHQREAHKLEALGALAAGVAHDFNNILSAILGNVALVAAELGADAPARLVDALARTRRAGERGRDLVARIVGFGARAASAGTPQAVVPAIEGAIEMLRAILPPTVRVRRHFESPEAALTLDGADLQRLVMNLATNAVHAMPGGGELAIGMAYAAAEAVPAHDAATTAERWLRLWVADSGQGIAPEIQQRIFEPYFTTKPPGQGSGLGLAVVRGIVQAHGGCIAVHSRPHEGARFDVFLPVAPPVEGPPPVAPARPAAAPARTAHTERSARILLVDDDEVVGLTLQALLERAGHEVLYVSDARTALAALARPAERAVELVITDHSMPAMSGIEFARRLRERHPALPLLLASGHVGDEVRAQAAELAIHAIVPKERALEDLPAAVQSALAAAAAAAGLK